MGIPALLKLLTLSLSRLCLLLGSNIGDKRICWAAIGRVQTSWHYFIEVQQALPWKCCSKNWRLFCLL